jgi:Yip1 domain
MTKRAVDTIKNVIISPETEWDLIARDAISLTKLTRLYIIPLALIAPIATTIGMHIFDLRWSAKAGYAVPRNRIWNVGITNFVLEVITVFLIAATFYGMARTEGVRCSFLDATKVAVFGAAPLMLSGALLIMPISVVACMFVMVYSMALYYAGVQRVLGIHKDNAAIFVAMSMAIMCLVSALIGGAASQLGLLL